MSIFCARVDAAQFCKALNLVLRFAAKRPVLPILGEATTPVSMLKTWVPPAMLLLWRHFGQTPWWQSNMMVTFPALRIIPELTAWSRMR